MVCATRRLRGLGFVASGDTQWTRAGEKDVYPWHYRRYRYGDTAFVVRLVDGGFALAAVHQESTRRRGRHESRQVETLIARDLSLEMLVETIQRELNRRRVAGRPAKKESP